MPAKPKRKKMLQFDIGEISGVDAPAQEHATVDIMLADMAKAGRLVAATSVVAGHSHAVRVGESYSGASKIVVVRLIPAIAENSPHQHSHELYRVGNGPWQIPSELGHTHSVDSTPIDAAIRALNNPNTLDMPAPAPDGGTVGPDGINKGNLTMQSLELALAAQLSTGQYDHLGGPETRKAVLAPICAMTDQKARDHALQALRQGSSASHARQVHKPTDAESAILATIETMPSASAEAELEKLAEARADATGASYQVAYSQVLKSARGRELSRHLNSTNGMSHVSLLEHVADLQRDQERMSKMKAKQTA